MIAAPLFHSWGFAQLHARRSASRSTVVLRRGFDPEATLRDRPSTAADALAVVPVMLQRILELAAETLDRYDARARCGSSPASPAPRCPASSPSRGWITSATMLYNLYGSTEVAWATIATPRDLRAAPGTAGRPPLGTIVQALRRRRPARSPDGETGRIFVGNDVLFEGYTGGGNKGDRSTA